SDTARSANHSCWRTDTGECWRCCSQSAAFCSGCVQRCGIGAGTEGPREVAEVYRGGEGPERDSGKVSRRELLLSRCFYNVVELEDVAPNPNDECRNPKETRSSNAENGTRSGELQASDFGLPSSFEIRHSSLYSPHTLGHDLEQRGRLPIADCVPIGFSLTTALARLHQHSVVHRDIEPALAIFVNDFPTFSP